MTSYAPYSNAMRLGQGFNSYAQTICIDNAVVFDGVSKNPPPPPAAPEDDAQKQVVTYSAGFVDKLSDVVEATNLSPSTSIKSGSIGNSGKGGGGFIDCDKFKEAHLNYLVHAKVTVQSSPQSGTETPRFQRIKSLPPHLFHRTFGDCFISGFLSGGEFSALVSFRFLPGVDLTLGRKLAMAALTPLGGDAAGEEAGEGAGVGGVGGVGADVHVLRARRELATKAEVSVTVSWSGGGQRVFSPAAGSGAGGGEQWDISSVMRAAARFPSAVASCPQRIAAVLTRYTTLRSFVEQMPAVVPLDYDNTVLYSGDLLDAYMEYKHLVKQLNLMLETPHLYAETQLLDESREEIKPIRLQLSELDDAKTYCRQQMLRIVKEVDNIAKNPELACDEEHLPPFMSAELFKAMMPVLRHGGMDGGLGGHMRIGGSGRSGRSSRGSGVEGRLGKRDDDGEEEGVLVAASSRGYEEYSDGDGEGRALTEVGHEQEHGQEHEQEEEL